MNESAKKSQAAPINDVDECNKKWAPVTKGMSEESAPYAAWLMEREAKFMQGTLDKSDHNTLGPVLKYVFPVVRVAVRNFTALDRLSALGDRDKLSGIYQSLVRGACDEILDADYQGCVIRELDSEGLKDHKLIRNMGSRLADSTLSYPRWH